jgi:hypothetical protein
MTEALNSFDRFYAQKHEGRKLMWVASLVDLLPVDLEGTGGIDSQV